MALVAIRFDLRAPEWGPATHRELYAAALEQAVWADEQGLDIVVLSEHHSVDDGYLPSPLVLGAAVAGRTQRIPLTVAALLVPLHDPLRLAEDIAVLDLISGGRVSIVAGTGYRREEYDLFDRPWVGRTARFEACVRVLQAAWTGKPFEYEGRTVRVTPRPLQQPHPPLFVGGSVEAAARRAARLGAHFFPSVGDPALAEAYRDECATLGREPGMIVLPKGPGVVFVAEDPDRAWATIGRHLLYDATTYARWQPEGQRSAAKAEAGTVEDLRAEGVYRILTPEEVVALATELGPGGTITLHPMCGGIPPATADESLDLVARRVLPALREGERL
jgi:alkanesulfonate monooxygenase SsuD/methylene tetrahydromethanopterin reductase-like flavin-dependent oxidoreductase (luciferase family)